MANQYANKVIYGNDTLVDLTGDTVTAADVRQGVSFHLPSGASGIGTAVNGYTIYMTTTSTEFYGQTITVSQNGSVIGTTSFDNQGNAQYSVDSVGTYTVSVTASGTTVSEEVVVSQIEIELEAGFQYKRWLGLTDLDPDNYASLADVLADEEAVRQLMTVHASVDYLASFTATDTSVVAILNNDIAAKWITVTAYAEDVLTDAYSALMESIGKYGYGKWVITDNTTTPPTWGALGNVPIMTSNTAPYGEVVYSSQYDSTNFFAWHAFDGDKAFSSYGWIGGASDSAPYVGYKSTTPIKAKKAVVMVQFRTFTNANNTVITVEGSNDNSTYHSIGSLAITGIDVSSADVQKTYEIPLADEDFYLYHRIKMNYSMRPASTNYMKIAEVQFYGRQMNVSVPTMTGNTSPYGVASASSNFTTNYPAYKAFDGDVETLWASAENTNDQWVEYEFSSPVKLCKYYIKPAITISGSTSYTKTAQVSVQGYIDGSWADISEKTLVSNPTASGANTTPAEISGSINNHTEITKVRVNFGEKVGVQRDCVFTLQFYGFDYSEKEWDVSHPRHYIYDNGVELETLVEHSKNGGSATPGSYYYDVFGGTNSSSGGIGATLDLTPYNLFRATIGEVLITAIALACGTAPGGNNNYDIANASFSASNGNLPRNMSLDVSNVNQSAYINTYMSTNGRFYVTEMWLE